MFIGNFGMKLVLLTKIRKTIPPDALNNSSDYGYSPHYWTSSPDHQLTEDLYVQPDFFKFNFSFY